jgi:hypothetical protein
MLMMHQWCYQMDDSVVFLPPRKRGPGTVGTEIAALDAGSHPGYLGNSRDNFSEIWLRIPHNLAHLTLSPRPGGEGLSSEIPSQTRLCAIRAFIKLTKYC